jgi:hypothetical protein
LFQTNFFQQDSKIQKQTSLRSQSLYPITRNRGKPVGNLAKKRKVAEKSEMGEA